MKQNTKGGKRKGSGRKKSDYETKLLPFVFVLNLSNRLKKWLRIMFLSVLKVTHNGYVYGVVAYK